MQRVGLIHVELLPELLEIDRLPLDLFVPLCIFASLRRKKTFHDRILLRVSVTPWFNSTELFNYGYATLGLL